MKFKPKYTITNQLLENIKTINRLVFELNNKHFPNIVLMNLEKEARAVSSYASTNIEGNPLPLTEVKRLLKNSPKNARDTEKEVINYNKALESLNNALQKKDIDFNKDLILKIHKDITLGLLQKYQTGKYRIEPVVVNNPKTGQVVYLPPEVTEVEYLMQSLITFVNENKSDIDPLILAGIFHKQFVIIHPFIDGNGRTCRLATKVLLANLGLNTFNLFSFENYYNNNVTKYFQYVGVQGNYYEILESIDFTEWLEYFTGGIIDEIYRVKKDLDLIVSSPETSLLQDQEKIINHIKSKGFITDYEYSLITDRAKATRVMDFNKLISLNLIQRKGSGRKTFYVLTEK